MLLLPLNGVAAVIPQEYLLQSQIATPTTLGFLTYHGIIFTIIFLVFIKPRLIWS